MFESKEEITNNIDKLHRIGKTDKNNMQNTIIKFKSHSFKEKIYFKRNEIKQRDFKIKPSLAKHQIKLVKRCQHFNNGQPWDQLSLCICRCTWEFENSFERCKKWTGSGKDLLMRKTLIIYLLKVFNLHLNFLYKFDFDVLVFS